jgi:signal transduction histidine kinase
VLIPSVVALILWLVASGYLLFNGFVNRTVANSVRQVSIPAVPALASIQQERRLSIAYLAQPSKDVQGLIDQRRQTDQRLSALRAAANSALAGAPESITTRWTTLTNYLDQLPSVRSTVDSRSTSGQHVYDSYNKLLTAATDLFDTQARVVPDVTATLGALAATDTFRASDLMSRAGSTIDGAFGARTLSPDSHLEFVSLVGAYHSALTNVAPHLLPDVRKRYESLVASSSWKTLTDAENALISDGAWRSGVPRNLPVSAATWETVTRQVSDGLINLTIAQADEVSAQALRTGNNQLLTASLGSLIALSIAITAIVWAIRQSQVLVDQALSVRLAQLGRDAAAVVDRLPAMMARLRGGEKVDLEVEFTPQHYGSDEIGQMADVFNRSLRAAVGAAADEAVTRAAAMAMLEGVARRPQGPLQRAVRVIVDLQNRIGNDEQLLAELFDVDHNLTQTRRFLENLVILAGGQIRRRFQNPVPLDRLLMSAFAETQQYQRISLRSPAPVAVVGHATASTTHLLSELIDNALQFSPPNTTVWVTCNNAALGVSVEIEDAGFGMSPEVLKHTNELLATAPTPDVTALRAGALIGLWVVAELAKQNGIQVTLRTSAYGGLLAIVLLPDRLIAAGGSTPELTAGGGAPPALSSPQAFLPAGTGYHGLSPGATPSAVGILTAPNNQAHVQNEPHISEGGRPYPAGGTMHPQVNGHAGLPQRREPSPGPATEATARSSPATVPSEQAASTAHRTPAARHQPGGH